MEQKLSDKNKVKIYDFISHYERYICTNFGNYNINDANIRDFIEKNRILLGTLCKTNFAKIGQYQYFIL